jgi:hypothetical protein
MQALALWLKGERWTLALAAGAAEWPRRRAFAATVIGNGVNLLLPARLGDVVRALILRRHNDVSASRALMAGWSVQIFDLLAVGALLMLAGSTLVSRGMIGAFVAAAVAILLVMAVAEWRPHWPRRVEAMLLGGRHLSRLRPPLERARQGLHFLVHGRTLVAVVVMTGLIWTTEVASTIVALRAFGIPAGPALAALLVGAGAVAFMLPLTPGNVGVFQGVCVLVLGAAGVDRDRAFAFGLGAHAFFLALGLLAALLLLRREGLDLSWVRTRAAHASREA